MQKGFLDVPGHKIYYEVHGKGRPAVVLHGGPGGGMQKSALAAYDLKKWCVVMFDQRGCGKSVGSLENNTTWDLVEDIELLRNHFGFEKWFVSGGSWGTTLALAYAEKHPSKVTGLLLRGVCLCDESSFKWQYEEGGASRVFPETWQKFIAVLPQSLKKAGWFEIAKYFQKKLQSNEKRKYAKAWWEWELSTSYMKQRPDDSTPKEELDISRLENHYFVNRCWLEEGQLLKNINKLKHIPITIVHGRYDMVCPINQAYAIKQKLPHTKLVIIPNEGHASTQPGIKIALRRATQSFLGNRETRKRETRKH